MAAYIYIYIYVLCTSYWSNDFRYIRVNIVVDY